MSADQGGQQGGSAAPRHLELLREKLEGFLVAQATATDEAKKFQLKVEIRDLEKEIAELETRRDAMTETNRARQLRDRLVKLEAARDVLGPDTYREMRGEIEAEIRRLDAGTGDSVPQEVAPAEVAAASAQGGSIAFVGDAQDATFITGNGNQIQLGETDDPEKLLRAYLASLAAECGRLPLGTIDMEFVRDGVRIGLPEVYVELDVTTTARPSDEEHARDWAWRLAGGDAARRQPAGDALSRPDHRRHVLLGDPGSGKTTLAHHLCRALAMGGDVGEEIRGLVPVRFVLRDVARNLGSATRRGSGGLLWDALLEDLEQRLGANAAPRLLKHLRRRVLRTGAFWVLDGLDEVPESGPARRLLLDAVKDLVSSLAAGPSRFLVTARPYAYADPRWHLEDFEVLALSSFREEQVQQFIEGWYLTAARRAFLWSEETARHKAEQLRTALAQRPYLADLASRPLLLTLMATLHSSWGQLPEDRAELYEQTVKLLLGRWQRARETGTADGEPEESLSQLLRVPEDRLRGALENLAFSVHEKQAAAAQRDERPAEISEGELLVAFKPLLGTVSPEELVAYLENRAGLLISRRSGLYAFPHRSFQEYLAACHLGSLPDPTVRFRQRAFEDAEWWREVILLGIGRARRGGLGNAVSLVTALLPAGPPEMEAIEEDVWPVAVLAGLALLDLRILGTENAELPQYRVVLKRIRDWLVRLVEEGRLRPKERVEAGDVLGRLDDPRPGIGVVEVEGVSVPDIDWVEIPAGPFTMGSSEEDIDAQDHERPQREDHLDRFWISRYPVTNAQYRVFWESDEYTDRELWTEAGWEWLQGAEVDVSVYPEDLREQATAWFAGRPKEKRLRPFYWNHERLASPTRPVVGITWYEAVAFCRWLSRQPATRRGLAEDLGSASCRVELPSEAHWEKAARDPGGEIWPWGPDWEADACNSEESEIGETCAVGIFPRNRSFRGVVDLSGGVWEWTTTIWSRRSFESADYTYPYAQDDGRNELAGTSLRILRGGSWYHSKNDARCAARYGHLPGYFFVSIGFRVILSLAHTES